MTVRKAAPLRRHSKKSAASGRGVALYHLLEGTKRFSELKRDVGNVTQRMLTKQLRELEADGLINRKIYPVVPPRVEYSLSEKGQSLKPILMALRDWGNAHVLSDAVEAADA